jgi:uncharacterized protein YjbI with pentapeptide repeats
MGVRTGLCLLKMLAAVCFAIAIMAVVSERILAATQTPSAQASTTSCLHPLDEHGRPMWKPTLLELHLIVARHFGYLITLVPYLHENAYLDHIKPAYPDWRREASSHPARANLCNAHLDGADLNGAHLSGAHLGGAHLRGAHLGGAHLDEAHLDNANLGGADLNGAYLNDAYLIRANLDGANLSNAELREAVLRDAHLSNANLRGADLTGADFGVHLNFNGADLNGAKLAGAILNGVELQGSDLSRADLRDADLSRADLSDANLSGADLSRANLNGAHLNGAGLNGTKLAGANLNDVNLNGAHLNGAHLNGAKLGGAHLGNADLTDADLTDADLNRADLTRADLNGAKLNGAQVSKTKLAYVNLTGATYAPVSVPPDPYVAGVKGLETLNTAVGEQIGLVQLRKLLQDAGLRDAEREATSAIERNVTRDRFSSSWQTFAWVEGTLRFVGFDVTTAYGLYPTYALGWILLLGAVLTPVYMRAMLHPADDGRVIQVFPKDRPDRIDSETIDEKDRKVDVKATNLWNAFRAAAYFSLLSAVNIGFDKFTVGDWLRRLQSREYSLEAVGWVRIVAGAQALLSVYLLAMWALTQFSRPFD